MIVNLEWLEKIQPDDTSLNLCHPAEKIFLFNPASTYHIELINIFFRFFFFQIILSLLNRLLQKVR